MFIIIELQTGDNGVTGNIVTTFENRNEAESKYHSILSAAAKSSISIHTAIMLNEKGVVEKSEYYTH